MNTKESTSKKKVVDIITDQIIAELEAGTVPWARPWTSEPQKNLISKKAYRGFNQFVLGWEARERGYNCPWWATFKQISDKGGRVRKGIKPAMKGWAPNLRDKVVLYTREGYLNARCFIFAAPGKTERHATLQRNVKVHEAKHGLIYAWEPTYETVRKILMVRRPVETPPDYRVEDVPIAPAIGKDIEPVALPMVLIEKITGTLEGLVKFDTLPGDRMNITYLVIENERTRFKINGENGHELVQVGFLSTRTGTERYKD